MTNGNDYSLDERGLYVNTGDHLTFSRTREQRLKHYPNISEEKGINCKIVYIFIYKILIYKIYNIEL